MYSGPIPQVALHDWEESLCSSVWYSDHEAESRSLASVYHPKHPHLMCCWTWYYIYTGKKKRKKTSQAKILKKTLRRSITDFGLVTKQRFVNLYNDSRATEHEGCILEKTPAANISEVLVCLDGTLLLYLGLLSSITNWVLADPPIHEDNPLPQRHLRLLKECPIPQPH